MVETLLSDTSGADNEWISLNKYSFGFCYRAVPEHEDLSTSPMFSSSCNSVTFPHWAISYFLTGRHALGTFLPAQQGVVFRQMSQDDWVDSITEPKANAGRCCQVPAERLQGLRNGTHNLPPARISVLCRNLSHMNLELFYLHMVLDCCTFLLQISKNTTQVSPITWTARLFRKQCCTEQWGRRGASFMLYGVKKPSLPQCAPVVAVPGAAVQHGCTTSQVWHSACLKGTTCGGQLLLQGGMKTPLPPMYPLRYGRQTAKQALGFPDTSGQVSATNEGKFVWLQTAGNYSDERGMAVNGLSLSPVREKKPRQGHGWLKAVQLFAQAHTRCAQQHHGSELLCDFKWSQDDAFKGTSGRGSGEKSGLGGQRRKKMQPGKRHLAAWGVLCCLWPSDFLCSWLPCPLLQDPKQHYHREGQNELIFPIRQFKLHCRPFFVICYQPSLQFVVWLKQC